MNKFALLLGAALLATAAPAFAGGFGHYDLGEVIRYIDHDEDWSVSISIGDRDRGRDWDDDRRRWDKDREKRYREHFNERRWIPPGQYKKGFRRGFREGYREGFGDGYASASCYEDRYDRWGRRIRVELPSWQCR